MLILIYYYVLQEYPSIRKDAVGSIVWNWCFREALLKYNWTNKGENHLIKVSVFASDNLCTAECLDFMNYREFQEL